MEKLTRLEEEIMLIVWKLEQAFVKDIIDEMPEPKPHYNTVSTMMKLLQEKQFVSYTAYGKTYQYYPLITKENYCSAQVKPMLKNYFEGSTKNLVFFHEKGN